MNVNKKKTVLICVGILVASIVISGIGMYLNRSTSREPTQEEIDAYAPYVLDRQNMPGAEEGKGEAELILSVCTDAGEEEIGGNTYQVFTSDLLSTYLYKCAEIKEITMRDSIVYISYNDTDGRTVILAYGDAGLCERGIYDPETDTFYHEMDGKIEVWMKFRNGIQWGR